MDTMLRWVGRSAGIAGLLLCALAGLTRLAGYFYLGGFELITLLQAGVAAMVTGCFLLLWAMSARDRA